MQKEAKGIEGFLLIYPDFSTAEPTGEKNRFGQERVKCKDTIVVFRVYEKPGTGFKDYDIRHPDLKIKLLDGVLYETEEGNYIDYE
jgi:hypothetical protein